jgi:hypothetical protein
MSFETNDEVKNEFFGERPKGVRKKNDFFCIPFHSEKYIYGFSSAKTVNYFHIKYKELSTTPILTTPT